MFGRVRDTLSEAAERFDPALVDAEAAERVLDDAIAIRNTADAVVAQAAARIADTSWWKRAGASSAAQYVARRHGISLGEAKTTIETGRRLRELSATTAVARRGKLSAAQTATIADAATVDPAAETQLLARAETGSLPELRAECAKAKANVTDLETRRRRIHEQRRVRHWVDTDGAGHLHLTDNPERVAAIVSRIHTRRDERHEQAQADGRREPLEAHAADALHDLVCGCEDETARTKPNVKLLVRVDLDALLRGYPMGDETCEIVGYGPVAVSAVRDLIDTGDPFLTAIATKGEAVAGIAHLGRRANAKQQTALEWLYPTCAAEGCNNLAFLENDHREDWARTGLTVLDWLDRLCPQEHWLKTTKGWALVEGHGKRPFVPPDDPRHPNNANGPPAAEEAARTRQAVKPPSRTNSAPVA